MKPKEKALLVTTVHRGVFFGYGDGAVKSKTITIQSPSEARGNIRLLAFATRWTASERRTS